MSIGIIGSGVFGSNVARAFARKGIAATIANSRGPASMASLVDELGPSITAGTVEEAASKDIVIVAVLWANAEETLRGLPAWNGRIVIDGTNAVEILSPNSAETKDKTNPLAMYGIRAVDLGDRYSSEVIRQFVPGARLVKAFNHLDAKLLAEAEVAGGQRVIFYSGDDAAAMSEVRSLIEASGFFAISLGSLDVGGRLASLPFGTLSMHNLVRL